jgi:hypothetical protein
MCYKKPKTLILPLSFGGNFLYVPEIFLVSYLSSQMS